MDTSTFRPPQRSTDLRPFVFGSKVTTRYLIGFCTFVIVILVRLYFYYRQNDLHVPNNITVVSGFWDVTNKFNHNQYKEWFANSLKINQRYILFGDGNTDNITKFRPHYETVSIQYALADFVSRKYAKQGWIHPVHVPSKELGMIWNEKIHMMKLAKEWCEKNKTDTTEFYIWIDAGIAPYRNVVPPSFKLTLKNVHDLPHDKIIYTDSEDKLHNFSGGAFMIHRGMIDTVHETYYNKLGQCNNASDVKWHCGVDQIIFKKMREDNPALFYKIGNGYGSLLAILYDKYV